MLEQSCVSWLVRRGRLVHRLMPSLAAAVAEHSLLMPPMYYLSLLVAVAVATTITRSQACLVLVVVVLVGLRKVAVQTGLAARTEMVVIRLVSILMVAVAVVSIQMEKHLLPAPLLQIMLGHS